MAAGNSAPEPLFFYGHTPNKTDPFKRFVFSNFYPAKFHDPATGDDYTCSEQYMMVQKARLFLEKAPVENQGIMDAMLASRKPAEIKKLGRRVKGFDGAAWDKASYEVVKQGCRLKFSQNEDLGAILKKSHPRFLVEAAGNDKIWGSGLNAADSARVAFGKWPGQNRLGRLLNEIRDELLAEGGGGAAGVEAPPPGSSSASTPRGRGGEDDVAKRPDSERKRKKPRLQ